MSVWREICLPFFLRDVTVDGFAWDGVLHEHFGKLDGVLDRFNKYDDLVELQVVNQVHQFGNLFTLVKLHVVLAETVQGQFAFVLNQDLGLIAHELAAS